MLGGEDLGLAGKRACPACRFFDAFDARRRGRMFDEHSLAKFSITQEFVCVK